MTHHAFSLGIDIGGTAIKGVVLLGDKIVKRTVMATPKSSAHLLKEVALLVENLRGDREVSWVGIAVGGTLNRLRNEMVIAPNVKPLNRPRLRYALARALGKPVILENDANAGAWAEYKLGAGVGTKNLIFFSLGTGVGGGVIIDGKLHVGSHGAAGELGHMIAVPGGVRCTCSQQGCLESYASLRFLRQRGIEDPAAALRRGGRGALRAFGEMGRMLGLAFVSIANALDPEVIVVGGGLSGLGDAILKPAREEMRKSPLGHAARHVLVKRGALGRHAGAIGAALLTQKG